MSHFSMTIAKGDASGVTTGVLSGCAKSIGPLNSGPEATPAITANEEECTRGNPGDDTAGSGAIVGRTRRKTNTVSIDASPREVFDRWQTTIAKNLLSMS